MRSLAFCVRVRIFRCVPKAEGSNNPFADVTPNYRIVDANPLRQKSGTRAAMSAGTGWLAWRADRSMRGR
jgi:hypothetical protein